MGTTLKKAKSIFLNPRKLYLIFNFHLIDIFNQKQRIVSY